MYIYIICYIYNTLWFWSVFMFLYYISRTHDCSNGCGCLCATRPLWRSEDSLGWLSSSSTWCLWCLSAGHTRVRRPQPSVDFLSQRCCYYKCIRLWPSGPWDKFFTHRAISPALRYLVLFPAHWASNNETQNTETILNHLTTVRVMRSISCLSLVLCCLKGLWL